MCNNFNSNTQAVISRKYAIANVISSNKVEFLSEFGLKIQCTKPRVLISRLSHKQSLLCHNIKLSTACFNDCFFLLSDPPSTYDTTC